MGAFVVRQPNGLLCRFSTVVDTVTHYNMTEEDYIEMCAEKAREEARAKEDASRLLAMGKLTYEEIAKCTDLPVEEIKNLADLQLA